MPRVGSFNTYDLEDKKRRLFDYFEKNIIGNASLPDPFKEKIYPQHFLSSNQYLLFPLFFRNCFATINNTALNQLCSSGYLYFKYLLCIDGMMDKDPKEGQDTVSEDVWLLRSHVYHEQSIRLLSQLFPASSNFWNAWKIRSAEFMNSLLLDKLYKPDMDFEIYKRLSAGKCSFLKASVDAFFYQAPSRKKKLYQAIQTSLDYLAIGRCLQDDFEDFKKDLTYKKNNYGHVLLNEKLLAEGKTFTDYSPHLLEKLFYTTKVAEELLEKSKTWFNKAIAAVETWKEVVPEYMRHLESFRNKSNLIKVNIEAYRITKFVQTVQTTSFIGNNKVEGAIRQAGTYIATMQNADGSWHEVSNKQGLSNVWATAFIAMNLDTGSAEFDKASQFLMQTRQKGIWGYNSDWVSDFDSTTCSLIVLKRAHKDIQQPLKQWLAGQHTTGGFPTYSPTNNELAGYLGFRNNSFLSDWTSPHVCVSALAYYLLSSLQTDNGLQAHRQQLRSYLLKNINEQKVWKPYWWSSFIYPTVFSVKALLEEKADNEEVINAALKYLLSRQSKDGSFKCDVLRKKSVLYTSLVLELLCQSPRLFQRYRSRAELMKEWLLTRQYTNGAFESTDFLLIPIAASDGKTAPRNYKLNKAGGTGSITGEIAGLFSTATALKALTSYDRIKNEKYHD